MEWIELSVQADGEAAEAVSELFNRLNSRPDGQGGAVTEVAGFDPIGEEHRPRVVVRTYLYAGDTETPARQQQIEEGLWFLGRIYPLGEQSVRRLAEEDWANAWKAHYEPLHIGRRWLVIPAWQTAEVHPQGDDLPIVLDPGMAFGTGLHPSTQLCLRLMEDLLRPGQRVLDAGCGSGILSIAAARLTDAPIDAFDIDPLAALATDQNFALNSLPGGVRCSVSTGPGDGPLWQGPDGAPAEWDVILVNILPHVIAELLDRGLHRYLAPGGRMVLAGIIEAQEHVVQAALIEANLRPLARLVDGDWVGLIAGQ